MINYLNVPDLYEAKTLAEAGVTEVGTFNSFPLKNGGITTWKDLWKLLYQTHQFILSLKGSIGGNTVDNPSLWSWASKYQVTGVTLYNIVRQTILSAYHIHWPIIALASGNVNKYPRNRYAIDAYSDDGQWGRLAGVPKMDDYSALTLDFLFQNGYGGAVYTGADGSYLSHNGLLFFMPYFGTGFNTSTGWDGELWINMKYVGKKLGQAKLISDAGIPTPLPSLPYLLSNKTLSLSHGNVNIHILEIDPTKVKFYVTPKAGLIRPSDALIKYGLRAAWNGDGFSFSTGLPIGTWASEGRVYQKNTDEDTLYIDKLGGFVTYSRPIFIWNAVSFPNRLLVAGAINANLESVSIAPRTAMGWHGSQVFVVVVDGDEYNDVGMTKPELAQYMLSLGCIQAINMDGGGSSALAVDGQLVSAKNDAGQERAIANVVGIY